MQRLTRNVSVIRMTNRTRNKPPVPVKDAQREKAKEEVLYQSVYCLLNLDIPKFRFLRVPYIALITV